MIGRNGMPLVAMRHHSDAGGVALQMRERVVAHCLSLPSCRPDGSSSHHLCQSESGSSTWWVRSPGNGLASGHPTFSLFVSFTSRLCVWFSRRTSCTDPPLSLVSHGWVMWLYRTGIRRVEVKDVRGPWTGCMYTKSVAHTHTTMWSRYAHT